MNKANKRLSKVLLISRDTEFSDAIERLTADFQEQYYAIDRIKSDRAALKRLKANGYDVCLIDCDPGKRTRLTLLHEAIRQGISTPLILLTGEAEEKMHIEAMRSGAAYCLTKEKLDASLLEQAIGYAIERGGSLNELRGKMDKYRNLVETLPVMIYAAEPQPPYASIYVSPAFAAFGYSLKEWNDSKDIWMRLLHPEDSERVLKETELMMNAGRETDLEYRIITKDGAVRWVHDRGHFVRDENGKLFCWQGVILDITKRKLAEAESDRRGKLYSTLAQNTPHTSVVIFDKDFRYSIAEILSEHQYGFDAKAIEGKTLWEAFPPEIWAEWESYYHRALNGETVNFEKERDGKYFQLYVVPVRNDGGEIFAGMILWQDITERKLSEKALRESEERYRDIFDNANDLIYVHDLEGNYLSINKATEKVIGYTLEEALELNMRQVVAPEHLNRSRRRLAEKLTDRTQQTIYETDCMTKDGRRIILEINSSAICKNGEAVAVQGIARDITERKRTETALKEREEQYRELFENANDIIYTRDLNGKFTSLNRAGEIIIGYTREEILEMLTSQIVAPDYLEEAHQMFARQNTGEPSPIYEIVIISKQGARISLEFSTSLIIKDGKPVGVQGIARNITERKRAEKFLQASESELKDLFDNAPTGYHELDCEGRIVRINRTELEMLGYDEAEEVIGRFAWEFVIEPVARESVIKKLSGDKKMLPLERTFRRKDGSLIPVMLRDALIKDENGKITGIRANIQDISEQKVAEQALKDSEQKYRQLGEGIMHQIWTAQPDGKIDYVNWRTLEYFGRTYSESLGDGWNSMVHPNDVAQSVENWNHSLKTGDDYETEFRLRRHDGKYFWFQARATAGRGAEGEIISWFGTNTDIDDRKKAEAKLRYFAGHDALTNLPNRSRFMNYLKRAVKRSEHNPAFRFAVLFLDLDRFKVINDSLGHSIGDKLLLEIAERLEDCVRPHDIVARLGGDEFTVLLTRINDHAEVVHIADRFLEKLAAPFKLDNYEVFTSASIGIVVSDEVKRQPEDFLRDADTAMYRAKAAGKSRYEIFDREMHIRNMNLLQMENDLRKAIEQNEFRVFYQPIIELETGKIREFESLIRWQHPQKGLVAPNEFIPIAEETGLIIQIGEWVLKESCRQTAEWQKRFAAHENLSISVNLSAKQLLHPNIIAQVKQILEKTGFNPHRLKLEVTESMVMENGDQALAVISELTKLGISLSTDDFGTGYSSLSYLHRFPFSRLKIDRSFVSKMDSDSKSQAIVRTILLLAQNLNIEVVAEGIETESQLAGLRQLDCKTGQGYLFSKPVTAEAAAELLQNGLPSVASFYRFGETENQPLLELDKIQ